MNLITTIICAALLIQESSLSVWVVVIFALSVPVNFSYKVTIAHLYQKHELNLIHPLTLGLCPTYGNILVYLALPEKPAFIAFERIINMRRKL
jgi:hypothetical protein